ncbi:PREDICTED: tetratricopeptide repeat protein 1-like isoform X2 [Nelumbo nucifera]|uniref:Tetratricopeptide repeat protein 1-like isoform X2 n=1 Tax=Nelumbo nucifera TaxID=4432 RepID=A0A1U8AKV1_NELNU|nr:PREDICTED: tetratricopeptide repeat protein 1-like isoform X2 [Nelumbo nucifera]
MVVTEDETPQQSVNSSAPEKASTASDEETTTREAEGYLTASDGEGEGDGEGEEQAAPSKDDSYEDALTDEQLKERALSQAADAKAEGNKLFGAGQYEDALSQYELALQLAPEMPSSVEIRSICHANRAICFLKLGKYNDTIKECTRALELNPTYMKALVRRGEAHEKLENYEEAISDMKKILESDPSNKQAITTIRRLEPLAVEKREKMKEEMIGKLKEMGNSLLGRFGMSLDNFKSVKDPNTGSYSISFQR